MLAQSENIVRIEGILSEINLTDREFTNKNNQKMPCISGTVNIKVKYDYKGNTYDVNIPVSAFAAKYTNSGSENPAYTSLENVKNNFVSIAASDEETADRIRLTNGTIAENAFYSGNQLITYPRINGSFFTKVKREEFTPTATFKETIVLANIVDEVDSEGVETGALNVQGVIIQYGEKADVVKFVVRNPSYVEYIKSHWNVKDTVRVGGIINYSSKTEYVEEEVGFGDPIKTPRTVSVREFILTSGSPNGLDSDFAYDEEELTKALAARKNRLEQLKISSSNKTVVSQPANSIATSLSDIDF